MEIHHHEWAMGMLDSVTHSLRMSIGNPTVETSLSIMAKTQPHTKCPTHPNARGVVQAGVTLKTRAWRDHGAHFGAGGRDCSPARHDARCDAAVPEGSKWTRHEHRRPSAAYRAAAANGHLGSACYHHVAN